MDNKERIIFCLAALTTMALLFIVRFDLKMTAFILISVILFFLSMMDIRVGVILLLASRSSMDFLIETNINIHAINISFSSLFACYSVVLILAYLMTNRVVIRNGIADSFYAFIIIATITALIPGNYHFGIVYVIKFISMLCIFLIVYYLNTKTDGFEKTILKTIIASSIIPLAIGLYQLIFGKGQIIEFYAERDLNRLLGTFVHPNVFAFFLIIIIITTFIYLVRYDKRNIFLYIIIALSLIELYSTYTRGAWIGLIFIFVVILALGKLSMPMKLALGAMFLIIVIPFHNNIIARFVNVLSSNIEESSLAARFIIWKGVFNLFFARPFLGYGIGSFKALSSDVLNWAIEAHNDYFKLLLETGVIGLSAFLILQIQTLILILRRKAANYMVLFAFILGFFMMSLGDNIIDMTVCQWYIWALVAIFVSKREKEKLCAD